jgi:Thiol-disulfide isomerase and thioredoxins
MMVKISFFLIFLLYGINGNCQPADYQVPKLSFPQLEPYLHKNTDTLYIINFWASWCVPCREELPAFEQIREKYAGKKVKVMLVSLDFPNELEKRLLPFLRKNNIKSDVVLLDDPNQNQWIDKVDPKWSGSLPFTQIYRKELRESYERSFRFHELDSLITLKINRL